MSTNLTIDQEILNLLLYHNTEREMKGSIRPISNHRACPICGKLFEEIPRLGFVCKEHKTFPRKFFVNIVHVSGVTGDKQRCRIFRDETGNVLESYNAARMLLQRINTDIEQKTFDTTRYVKGEQEKYYLVTRWEEYCARDYTKKTRKSLGYVKKHVFKYFNAAADIRNIKQASLQLFSEDLSNQVPTLATAKTIMSYFVSFLNYNHKQGLLDHPFTMPKFDEKKKKKGRYIPSIAESAKIISFIEESQRDIYLFLITHGCRPAEARALKAGDFNFSAATVTVQRCFSEDELHDLTKSGNEYTIPIHKSMQERLRQICMEKNPDTFVFLNKGKVWSATRTSKVWKEAAVKAGLPQISNYVGVKHAAASEIANTTGDIHGTSKFIGHYGGIKNTERYTKRKDIERLRKLQDTIVIPDSLIPH